MPSRVKIPLKIVVLTGTPGTGKTTLAEELSNVRGWPLIEINHLVEKYKLFSGVDVEDGAKIAKIEPLQKKVKTEIARLRKEMARIPIGAGRKAAQTPPPRGVILEGHLACEFSIPGALCIVLRVHPDELKRRLASRGYPTAKVDANALAETLDYCVVQAEAHYSKVRQLDTTGKSVAKVLLQLEHIIDGKRAGDTEVNWSREMFDKDVFAKFREMK